MKKIALPVLIATFVAMAGAASACPGKATTTTELPPPPTTGT